jgi:hypothetical protein
LKTYHLATLIPTLAGFDITNHGFNLLGGDDTTESSLPGYAFFVVFNSNGVVFIHFSSFKLKIAILQLPQLVVVFFLS